MSQQVQNENQSFLKESSLHKQSDQHITMNNQIQIQLSNSLLGSPISQQIQNTPQQKSQQLIKQTGFNNGTPKSRISQKKEEKQQSQVKKIMLRIKGQNYKIGMTQPICILKVRPLFVNETLISNKQMASVLDKESLVFHSNNNEDATGKEFLMTLTKDKIYRAHRMIPQDQTNNALYGVEFPQIIDNLLKGISHALFGLGSKQSGKTHSIFGTLSDPGLLLYFAQSLFAKKMQSTSIITIYLSIMKYEEDFQDLLCPTEEPLLFKQGKYGCHMPCITRIKIESLMEFYVYFRLALRLVPSREINKDLQIGQNFLNDRNHCIFRFQISHKVFEKQSIRSQNITIVNPNEQPKQQSEQFEKIEQKVYESEMVFIDCDHYDINERNNSRNVFQSLINLENIFQYIYEINKGIRASSTKIPYDSSKFTNYYKNYLFGKNQLILLGTLSPFRDHLDDSMKTARLAQWAFYSKNSVTSKVVTGVAQWKKQILKYIFLIFIAKHARYCIYLENISSNKYSR